MTRDISAGIGEMRRFRTAQVDRRNPPAQIARDLHIVIQIDRLMRAVERAKSQMHDANLARSAIIARRKDRGVDRTVHGAGSICGKRSLRAAPRYSDGVIPLTFRKWRLKLARFLKPADCAIVMIWSSDAYNMPQASPMRMRFRKSTKLWPVTDWKFRLNVTSVIAAISAACLTEKLSTP